MAMANPIGPMAGAPVGPPMHKVTIDVVWLLRSSSPVWPATDALFTNAGSADRAMLTSMVMVRDSPGANTLVAVHCTTVAVDAPQSQPVPLALVMVTPAGSVSV